MNIQDEINPIPSILLNGESFDQDDMLSLMNDFYKVNSHQTNDINQPSSINTNIEEKCINTKCSSTDFILEECNYICTLCGTLQEKFIDEQAEWRFYGHNDSKSQDPNRVGLATSDLFPEFSLGTVISFEYGKKNSNEMRNLCKYQRWNSTTYKERTLYSIVDNIYVNANNCGISQSIIEESKAMYKKLSEAQISRGANRAGIIASCVYWACKNNNVPRSSKEIAKMFNIETTVLTKGCKSFHSIMKVNTNSINPQDFIIRFCSNLNLDKSIVDLCTYIVKITEEYALVSTNNPASIACGVIYLACSICNLDITKKDISVNCLSSEVTINKCYKKLYSYRKLLLPEDIIKKYSVK